MIMCWAKKDDVFISYEYGGLESLLESIDEKKEGTYFRFHKNDKEKSFLQIFGPCGDRTALLDKQEYAKLGKVQRKMLIHYLTGNVEKTKWQDGNSLRNASWDME